MTTHKSYGVNFKTRQDKDGKDTGEVTAVVSVFGNVDTMGDRVVKGAFADSLTAWKDAGDPIPMVWSHDWSDPMSHIGGWNADSAKETDEGLELDGKVDIGVGNPIADQAYRLMKSRRVREFSFAYDVQGEKTATDGANELLKLDLIEAGPTLKGANSETRLLAAKAFNEALGKAGRTISAKNEQSLKGARDAIDAVLSSLETQDGKEHAYRDDVPEQFRRDPVNPNEPVTEPAPVDILPVDGTPKPATDEKDSYRPPADAPPAKSLNVNEDVLKRLEDAEIELQLSIWEKELDDDEAKTSDDDGEQTEQQEDNSEAVDAD